MGSYDRKTLVSAFKAFTTGWMQGIVDSLSMKDRAVRRRVDILDKMPVRPMLVRTNTLEPPAQSWVRPEITISKLGVVTNTISHTNVNILNYEMIIEAGPVINNPKLDAWSGGSRPSPIVTSACIIPGLNGSNERTGALWVLPKSAFGDKVAADTEIVLVRDASILAVEDITVDYDESSYDKLPDGTVWYRRWVISLPDGVDTTPEDIRSAIAAGTAFGDTYFDAYSTLDTGEDCFVNDGVEVQFGFTYYPLTLKLSVAAIDELYSKLTYLFDDSFSPASSGATRAVVIQLPESSEDDEAGILDRSRYLRPDGCVLVDSGMLKYDYEIDNAESAGTNIIVFAVRSDIDTVVFCDGTRVYRKHTSNGTFKPDAGSRRFILTGCGVNTSSIELLSYINESGYEGTFAPWTESNNGYYESTTEQWHSGVKAVKNVFNNDMRRFTFYKHGIDSDGAVPETTKGLLTLDRFNGIVSFGGDYASPMNISDLSPRNLRGIVYAGAVTYEWNDTLINVVASEQERTNAGLVFSRQRGDYDRCSYLFQGYTLPVNDPDSNWSTSPGSLSGLFMLTRARKIMLGAGPEDYKAVGSSDYLSDGSNWRSTHTISGGMDPASDAAYNAIACRGGATYTAGQTLPGINDYKSVQLTSGKWTGMSIHRVINAKGAGSADLNYPYDNVGLCMYTKESAANEAFIKLMRKIGNNPPIGSDPGVDIAGEIGLKVGRREHTTGSGLVDCAELLANTEAGLAGSMPKVAVFGGTLPFTFCGVTNISSLDKLGNGLFVLPGITSLVGGSGCDMTLNTYGIQMYNTPSNGSFTFNTLGRTFIKCGQVDTGPIFGGVSVSEGGIGLFQETALPKLVGLTVVSEGIHLYAQHEDDTAPITPEDTTIKATISVEKLVPPYYSTFTGTLKKRRIVSTEFPAGEDVLIFVID